MRVLLRAQRGGYPVCGGWHPPFLRFVGPYKEGTARISNRRANVITRISNRFPTGQSHLPLTEEP